jgi:phage pi2 protein 07
MNGMTMKIDTIEIPLVYYINDNGKYVFDDEEMHATLDEKVNEISLMINNRQLLN